MHVCLLFKIQRYLGRTGMPETKFGRLAVNDPRLVGDLRRGREPGAKLTARVERFIMVGQRRPLGRECDALSRLDAGALLRRALERSADAAGVVLTIERSDSTRWASATFAGARHELTLEMAQSAAADGWLSGLPETDLPLREHLVADLKIVAVARTADRRSATLEVLTVEER